MPQLSQRRFDRILIIKPSSFGDVIHALPVLHGLRSRFPRAHISWLVSHGCAGLIEGHPALDEVILFDRRHYGRMAHSLGAAMAFARFVRQLRARRFDLVVDLQGLFRSGFLALVSNARYRVGFAAARELGWMFYTHRVEVPDRDMHAVDRNYRFGGPLGFADVPIAFELPVRDSARASLHRKLIEAGLPPGEPYALIAPGTRWETKIWPAKHFAAVAERIARDYDLPVVLAGLEDEKPIAARVVSLCDVPAGRLIDMTGRTSLGEMMALVDGAAVSVMHDSGPMHLATALRKPMVAIYGPTSPRRTGPYGRDAAVVRMDLPCSPCYLKRVAECPHDHRCMNELSPERVLERVEQMVNLERARL